MEEATLRGIVRAAIDLDAEWIHGVLDDLGEESLAARALAARATLGALAKSRSWPAGLRDEAVRRYPLPRVQGGFDVPRGYAPRSTLLERIAQRGALANLRNASRPLTRIVVATPQPTTKRFPWELAMGDHVYLKAIQGSRLSGRYVQVAGTTGYELLYWAQHVRSTSRASTGLALERLAVSFLAAPGVEYKVLLETPSLDQDAAAFQLLVSSFR